MIICISRFLGKPRVVELTELIDVISKHYSSPVTIGNVALSVIQDGFAFIDGNDIYCWFDPAE